jgi:type IV fimbrial biogenesis protein FimT
MRTLQRPLRAPAAPRGFTLPETLMVLLVLSVLGVMALPAMQGMVQNYRIKTASFELFSTLNFARSEAIKRGAEITVRPFGAGWESGWRILDASGAVVKMQSALSGDLRISGPDSLVYEKDGRLPQAGMTAAFQVAVPDAGNSTEDRCVTVDLTGRPNTRKGVCP